MERTLIITDDGSHTLYVPALDEHYHSTRGAMMESAHVFMNAGLHYATQRKKMNAIHILEIGFGTGLNALLSWIECDKQKMDCYYETLEKYPLTTEETAALNYEPKSQLVQLHACTWENATSLSSYFTIRKIQRDLREYTPSRLFDLVFFDAFAPDIQPELWTAEIFQILYDHQPPGGILVTYSAKGKVKEALRRAGYHIQRLPGAGGKRHMIRAIKN